MADWVAQNASLLTAMANGAWMGLGLFVVIICHAILRWEWARSMLGVHHDLSGTTQRVLMWARLPALAHFAHRCYWNIGITFRAEGQSYADAIIEWKHVTIFFVALMIIGTYKTMAELCPPRDRRWLGLALAACVLSMTGLFGVVV